MPQSDAISLSGAYLQTVADQTRNANSVLHLYKSSFTPAPTSTKADFLAAEADFDGYAPQTIPAWAAPVLFGSGWASFAPTQTFRWNHVSADVGNSIGGYFLILSTGELMSYGVFNPSQNVSGPGMAVITTPVVIEGAGGF